MQSIFEIGSEKLHLFLIIDYIHFSIAIFPLQSQTAPEKLVVVFMYKHAIFMYILEFNPTDNCTINADGTVANQIR